MEKELNDMLRAFHDGENYHADGIFGVAFENGEYVFRVWAPAAERVYLVGEFNGWDESLPMERISDGESFEIRVTGDLEGKLYKYRIISNGKKVDKADPYGKRSELPPGTASRVCTRREYSWGDGDWLDSRKNYDIHRSPINIYEVHLASWLRDGAYPNYAEIAPKLRDYMLDMGYNYLELMPITEYPFDGSWGYQAIGYFSPTSRFGTPEELKYFVDTLHNAGIGVILDFVFAHFPKDEAGLGRFDGEPLYEYSEPWLAEAKSWGTLCFDTSRSEVRSFLISAVNYWIEEYHIDGIRFDAVSSMLYLDYDRGAGEWYPNEQGDNRNLSSVFFLQKLTTAVKHEHPAVMLAAEESSAWEKVTGRVEDGGLGFDYKWNLGYINDTLEYFRTDPIYRRYKHDKLTFPMIYAFSEHFILPVSHDETVHGKGSLYGKMFGDEGMKTAGIKAFFLYLMTCPGKKLTFMGCEYGKIGEWDYGSRLDFESVANYPHSEISAFVRELNRKYLSLPALYRDDDSWQGFEWLSCNDRDENVIAYCRKTDGEENVYVFLNFSGSEKHNYRLRCAKENPRPKILISSAPDSDRAVVGDNGELYITSSGPGGIMFTL